MLRKLHVEADSLEFSRGGGCAACAQTGYSGRVGIFEMLRLTTPLKELVSRRASEAEIKSAATAAGTRFLLGDALDKVRQGLTTAEEILRVIRIERADDAPIPGNLAGTGLEPAEAGPAADTTGRPAKRSNARGSSAVLQRW